MRWIRLLDLEKERNSDWLIQLDTNKSLAHKRIESTPRTGIPYMIVCQKYWKYTMYSVHHIRSSVMLSGNTSFCFFLTLSFPTQAMHFTPSLISQMHKWFWFNWEKSNCAYKLRKPLCILRKNKLGQYYFCGEKNKMVCTRAEKSDFWKSI